MYDVDHCTTSVHATWTPPFLTVVSQQGLLVVLVQVVSPNSRAPNAVDVLKMVHVTHLDPDQADTVLSLRM